MKKMLVVAVVLVAAVVMLSGPVQAASQDGRVKIQGYAEYLKFTGGDLGHHVWGGGLLGRYMFMDWLGAQTNVTFYGDAKTKNLGHDLKFSNWRVSLLAQTYIPNTYEKMHAYIGGGAGMMFVDNPDDMRIDNPILGHAIIGTGYKISDHFDIEAELGYQFGKADVKPYRKSNVAMDAMFLRLGANLRF